MFSYETIRQIKIGNSRVGPITQNAFCFCASNIQTTELTEHFSFASNTNLFNLYLYSRVKGKLTPPITNNLVNLFLIQYHFDLYSHCFYTNKLQNRVSLLQQETLRFFCVCHFSLCSVSRHQKRYSFLEWFCSDENPLSSSQQLKY